MRSTKSGRLKGGFILSLIVTILLALPIWVNAIGPATNTLVLDPNSSMVVHNGQTIQAVQPVTLKNGTNYAPLSSLAKIYDFQIFYDTQTKESIIKNDSDEIRFQANTSTIKMNNSTVQSAGPLFTQQGSLMVPLRTWATLTGSTFSVSEGAFTLSWKEKLPEHNEPPVAAFTTDKTEYRLGEPVHYTNRSYDDHNSIVRTTWTGKEPVFFEPGEYVITLEVEDQYGLTDSTSQTITVIDEQLYSKDEYYRYFTPVGDKFPIAGASVLNSMEAVPYTVVPGNMKFVRSNSPEHLYGDEGIGYEDTLSGKFRINIHNQNRSDKDLKVHLIATNPHDTAVKVEISSFGMGGPTTYVSTSGKTAVSRYLASLMNPSDKKDIWVPAGESKIITADVSRAILKPGLTMTSYTDLFTNKSLKFSVVITEPSTDPIAALPNLKVMDRDGRHIRGTFDEGSRTLEVTESLGYKPQRLVIGDRVMDRFVEGVDSVTGLPEVNYGNQGILYTMNVKVAPHTLVGLNARGGHYGGAFLVNGEVVNATDHSILLNQNEAAVLYRTGFYEETVEISFVLASGSNVPIHFLFIPMYEDEQSDEEQEENNE